ncbi:MAG: DUF5703 family protein [Micrococcales bacterium]|nr:DUF5703 family protein [Micrococcales bacterium]
MVEYEYRVVRFGRDSSRADIRAALTEHAEYGRWELYRTVVYMGGARTSWLRRRIIRAPRAS